MWQLNLPEYKFNIKKSGDKLLIFDSQRSRWVRLTPEEWVRQHFLQFLMQEKGYPAALLGVENELKVNGMKKRCDAILYDQQGRAQVIIEFKAPTVALTQKVFDQTAVYNRTLGVDYLMISNGMQHICCRVDRVEQRYEFLPEIPAYSMFRAEELL